MGAASDFFPIFITDNVGGYILKNIGSLESPLSTGHDTDSLGIDFNAKIADGFRRGFVRYVNRQIDLQGYNFHIRSDCERS